nr:ORF96 [Synechocystis sp. PCC 6803]
MVKIIFATLPRHSININNG